MCVYLQVAEPLLPYALSFAAGAMVYVVLDDLVPEANQWSAQNVLFSLSLLIFLSHSFFAFIELLRR